MNSVDLYGLPTRNSSVIVTDPIESYIYFYHLDELMVLPTLPETIADQNTVKFLQSNPLSRSAPIYSYSGAGPRSILFSFKLHRDLMKQVNQRYNVNSINGYTDEYPNADDYIEKLINNINACCVANYGKSSKMIDPPIVAVKIGSTCFIKGVVDGSVGVSWGLPVLRDEKHAFADISFSVQEILPYSADEIQQIGSFRNPGDSKIPTVSTSIYSSYSKYNKSHVNG